MNIKIVEKIQKLLALSKSSNENEAQLSLLKAQELLVKHKLSLKEVKEFKINNSSIKEKISAITFTKAKWKALLASVIAENFGCYFYLMTYQTNTIVFFGREEDTTICNIVLEYAIDCIRSKVNKLRYMHTQRGYSTKGIENDFALGFIAGLQKRFEEQKHKNKEWGLVLVKDKEVTEAYKSKSFTKTLDGKVGLKRAKNLYELGYKEGKSFSITDKIATSDAHNPEALPERTGRQC